MTFRFLLCVNSWVFWLSWITTHILGWEWVPCVMQRQFKSAWSSGNWWDVYVAEKECNCCYGLISKRERKSDHLTWMCNCTVRHLSQMSYLDLPVGCLQLSGWLVVVYHLFGSRRLLGLNSMMLWLKRTGVCVLKEELDGWQRGKDHFMIIWWLDTWCSSVPEYHYEGG